MQYSKNELVVALAKVYGVKLHVNNDGDVAKLVRTLIDIFECKDVEPADCKLIGDVAVFSCKYTYVHIFISGGNIGEKTLQLNADFETRIKDLLARAAQMQPKREAQSDGRKQCVPCGIAYPDVANFCRTCGKALTVE